jgi:hypothetical protein
MLNDPKARRIKTGEYETELKIAKSLDLICTPTSDASVEKLTVLKDQLLNLFLRLERGQLSCTDVKAQTLRIQEELSKVIWTVNDWQIQFASRN